MPASPDKFESLASAERWIAEKRLDHEWSHLNALISRTGQTLSLATAILGLVIGALVLSVMPAVAEANVWVKAFVFLLLAGSVVSLIVAIWSGLSAMEPQTMSTLRFDNNFVEQMWDLKPVGIREEAPKGDVDRLVTDIIFDVVHANSGELDRRSYALKRSVLWLRTSAICSALVLLLAVGIRVFPEVSSQDERQRTTPTRDVPTTQPRSATSISRITSAAGNKAVRLPPVGDHEVGNH